MNHLRLRLTSLLLLVAAAVAWAANVNFVTIPTKLVPGGMNLTVVTPTTMDPAQRFPTVYLLNGFGGDNLAWLRVRPDLPDLADRYGLVIVMPDGKDSWYWDAPERPDMKMETHFITELVPYVDAHFPTIPSAASRAISGLSMGGHGALWLAMRHPDVFGTAGSMSGGVDIRPFPKKWKMEQWLGPKEANPARWDQYTVATLAETLEPGKLNITFDCGADDFFAGVNDALHATLARRGIAHDYTSRPGVHNRQYWANSVLYHLTYFNEALKRQ